MSTSILHITDTHLFNEPSKYLQHSKVYPYPALVATLETAKKENPNPDIILLTGDFTQDDTEEAYELVAKTIEEHFPSSSTKKFAVMGNHEKPEMFEKIFLEKYKFVGPSFPSSHHQSPSPIHPSNSTTSLLLGT